MKSKLTHATAAVLASLAMSSSSFASELEVDKTGRDQLLAGTFAAPPEAPVFALAPEEMQATQGELWPWIIGVATLDLALASFFWGDYVPYITSSRGVCITCGLSKPR